MTGILIVEDAEGKTPRWCLYAARYRLWRPTFAFRDQHRRLPLPLLTHGRVCTRQPTIWQRAGVSATQWHLRLHLHSCLRHPRLASSSPGSLKWRWPPPCRFPSAPRPTDAGQRSMPHSPRRRRHHHPRLRTMTHLRTRRLRLRRGSHSHAARGQKASAALDQKI